jgi:hypothetical protein
MYVLLYIIARLASGHDTQNPAVRNYDIDWKKDLTTEVRSFTVVQDDMLPLQDDSFSILD